MEIKITAAKRKSEYTKTDSTLGSAQMATPEKYFPLFALMMKELGNQQQKIEQRSEI